MAISPDQARAELERRRAGGSAVMPTSSAPSSMQVRAQQELARRKGQAAAPPEKKDGFLKSLAKDVTETLVVKPVARATELATRTFAPNSLAARGYREEGPMKVLGLDIDKQKSFGNGGAKQIVGENLNAASYMIGGGSAGTVAKAGLKGKVLRGLWQGAKGGAVGGAMYGVGDELQKDESTIGSVAKQGALGGVYGAVGGAVLGGVLPVPVAAYKGARGALNPNNIMQRVARINALDQEKFAKTAGESVGEYLVKRGIYGDDEKIIQQLADRFTHSKNVADESLAKLGGTWKNGAIEDVLNELGEREMRISTTNVPSKDLNRVRELGTKYNKQGLTMSEINEVKRMYERNVKLGYLKENNTEKVAQSTNLDDALREWQFAQAEQLGLKNLGEINRETRLARQLGDALFKKNERAGGNNAFGLTDAVLISGGDPQAIAMLLTKKTLGSKGVQSAIAKKLAPDPTVGLPKAITGPVSPKSTVQDLNLPKPNTGIPSVIMGTQNKTAPRKGVLPVKATDAKPLPGDLTLPGSRPFGELNFKTKESTVPVKAGVIPVTEGSSKPKSPQSLPEKVSSTLPATILGKSGKAKGVLGITSDTTKVPKSVVGTVTNNKKLQAFREGKGSLEGGYIRNPLSKESQGVSSTDNTTKLGSVLPEKAPIGTPDPTLRTKREVSAKTLSGERFTIPAGTVLKPMVDGAKVNIKVGSKTYSIPKNQYQNLVGQSDRAIATPFAPELKDTVETVLGVDEKQLLARKRAGEDVNVHTTSGTTKYSQYTLDGGENYREILIQAPASPKIKAQYIVENKPELKRPWVARFPHEAQHATSFETKAEADAWVKRMGEFDAPTEKEYRSSHWSEPNVISHIRMNERTVDGKKYAFMEELQSDWARDGRDKGLLNPEDYRRGEQLADEVSQLGKQLRKLSDDKIYKDKLTVSQFDAWVKNNPNSEYAKLKKLVEEKVVERNKIQLNGVPNNPLLKNWQIPTVKRALMEAVDSGADRFAWINGKQTSERYNLATHVKEVEWLPASKSFNSRVATGEPVTTVVTIKPQSGGNIDVGFDQKGTIIKSDKSEFEGKKLDEVLGKGLADKIMEKETGTLSGEGLSFGGEWANNLYDRQVRDIVKKLTGTDVKEVDMGLPVKKGKFDEFTLVEGNDAGGFVTPSNLKKGVKVTDRNGTEFVVTDVLEGGEFRGLPVKSLDDYKVVKAQFSDKYKIQSDTRTFDTFAEAKKYAEDAKSRSARDFKIDSGNDNKTTQQYIDLTPEVKAKIKSEAPKFTMDDSAPGQSIPLLLLLLSGGAYAGANKKEK